MQLPNVIKIPSITRNYTQIAPNVHACQTVHLSLALFFITARTLSLSLSLSGVLLFPKISLLLRQFTEIKAKSPSQSFKSIITRLLFGTIAPGLFFPLRRPPPRACLVPTSESVFLRSVQSAGVHKNATIFRIDDVTCDGVEKQGNIPDGRRGIWAAIQFPPSFRR